MLVLPNSIPIVAHLDFYLYLCKYDVKIDSFTRYIL